MNTQRVTFQPAIQTVDLDSKLFLKLTAAQKEVYRKMFDITAYFFTRTTELRLRPFRGFLLEGPPASGKTEVALQVAKALRSKLATLIPPIVVTMSLIDSSVIAAPHWGEAEKALKEAFTFEGRENERHIILLDDIECLMLTRGSEIAKEWHYSINSVLFHRLDLLDPTKVMVFATTNRSDLIDEALRSRLYSFTVPLPTKEELKEIVEYMVKQLGLGESTQELVEAVMKRLESLEKPTLRYAQHFLIEECVERGFWRAEL
jgi:SpoVK/Ycf46/Vps4 family AAA+-type ATPase